MSTSRPYIVGVGGALHPGSTTEHALRHALAALDAEIDLFTGPQLSLPLYAPHLGLEVPDAQRMIAALRRADGIILAAPGYHGSLSGVMKNVLDYTEAMREDERPYFSGRAVGCIANAAGWQGAVATLHAMRDVVHALRGWPTPLGVCIAGPDKPFDAQGNCRQPAVAWQLDTMAREVLDFARRTVLMREAPLATVRAA